MGTGWRANRYRESWYTDLSLSGQWVCDFGSSIEPDTEWSSIVAQKGFDILRNVTDSRYRLSMVAGRRAAQLKKGVPSTVTGKAIANNENAVSAAMEELELGTGVLWGKDLPSLAEIASVVAQDERDSQREAARYSITRDAQSERDEAKTHSRF
jgi:DNA-directed RNA polymerase subunit K/omega